MTVAVVPLVLAVLLTVLSRPVARALSPGLGAAGHRCSRHRGFDVGTGGEDPDEAADLSGVARSVAAPSLFPGGSGGRATSWSRPGCSPLLPRTNAKCCSRRSGPTCATVTTGSGPSSRRGPLRSTRWARPAAAADPRTRSALLVERYAGEAFADALESHEIAARSAAGAALARAAARRDVPLAVERFAVSSRVAAAEVATPPRPQ